MPLFDRVHKESECIHKRNKVGSAEEKERPPNLSQYDTNSLKPKQKQKDSKTLQKQARMETPKVPLKLHCGPKTPSKKASKSGSKIDVEVE